MKRKKNGDGAGRICHIRRKSAEKFFSHKTANVRKGRGPQKNYWPFDRGEKVPLNHNVLILKLDLLHDRAEKYIGVFRGKRLILTDQEQLAADPLKLKRPSWSNGLRVTVLEQPTTNGKILQLSCYIWLSESYHPLVPIYARAEKFMVQTVIMSMVWRWKIKKMRSCMHCTYIVTQIVSTTTE